MTDEKAVGSLPDAGTIEPGDPGHIETHDEMARLMQVAADSLGIILDPPPPKPAVVGEYGHVDAHNTLLANIEQLAAAGGGGLPGELPALGTWAELTRATGSPKRYEYPDGETTWVAYEWTAPTGSVTTDAGGLVDCFLISGGSMSGGNGMPGGVKDGLHSVPAGRLDITVGAGGTGGGDNNRIGGSSAIGTVIWSRPHGEAITNGQATGAGTAKDVPGITFALATPYKTKITGVEKTYGNKGNNQSTTGFGDPTKSGVVICRVPKEFDNIPASDYVTRIDYYAEVTDGIVTDLYQEKFYGDGTVRTENGRYASPEQPDDLIPCDPLVAEGWTYDGKDFTPPPPPTREELIAELQARMDELTKDKK